MPDIRATARYASAIDAVSDLLSRLRLDFLFLGNVARSAWLGSEAGTGSIDVLATMGPQQKSQVAMMASNRGFRVEREEIDQSEELDVIPLHYVERPLGQRPSVETDDQSEIRVHVLVASNALYGRMVAGGVPARLGERELRVPTAEDFALLLAMMGDEVALRALTSTPWFDRVRYNDKLRSIGLGEHVLA
jgi:hypothetical protein